MYGAEPVGSIVPSYIASGGSDSITISNFTLIGVELKFLYIIDSSKLKSACLCLCLKVPDSKS